MRRLDFFSSLSRLSFSILMLAAAGLAGCGDEASPDDAEGTAIWSRRIGRASGLEPVHIAADASDGALVAGRFYGKVNFGGGVVESPANNYQVFLARYGAAGQHVYSRTYGDFLQEQVGGLGVDGAGHAHLAVNFDGTVDAGGGPVVSHGGGDVLLVELDAEGGHVASVALGDFGRQYATSYAVAPSGDRVLVGSTSGVVRLGDVALDPVGVDQLFVARLGPSGEHVWSRLLEVGYTGYGAFAAIDADGSVCLTSVFSTPVDLGGGTLSPNGDASFFVAKLGPGGEHLWSRAYGGQWWAQPTAMAAGPSGAALVTGSVYGDIDLGGGVLRGSNEYSNDPFVLALSPSGDYRFARRFVGASYAYGGGVAATADGGAIVTGGFAGEIDFGFGARDAKGNYSEDGFVVKLDASGTTVGGWTFGNAAPQQGSAVSIGQGGAIYLGGSGFGDYNLGDGRKLGSGYYDAFVARIGL
jgi:hypothetical protein